MGGGVDQGGRDLPRLTDDTLGMFTPLFAYEARARTLLGRAD